MPSVLEELDRQEVLGHDCGIWPLRRSCPWCQVPLTKHRQGRYSHLGFPQPRRGRSLALQFPGQGEEMGVWNQPLVQRQRPLQELLQSLDRKQALGGQRSDLTMKCDSSAIGLQNAQGEAGCSRPRNYKSAQAWSQSLSRGRAG